MTVFVTVAQVVRYQVELLRAQGEVAQPIISMDKLEAAVARPQASAFGEELYPSLAEKAAALLQSIVIGHPFLDGNKRAGLGAMLLFLALNGVDESDDDDALYALVINVATGELREVADIAQRITAIFAFA
jgi:death-on-curing protein